MRSWKRVPWFGAGLAVAVVLGLGSSMSPVHADEPSDDLSGTWTWKWKDAEGTTHEHKLVVEKAGDTYSASERFDDEEPVKVDDFKVKDGEVSFAVMRGDTRAAYFGKIAEKDTINGEVQVTTEAGQVEKYGWTAKREIEPEEPKDEEPKD